MSECYFLLLLHPFFDLELLIRRVSFSAWSLPKCLKLILNRNCCEQNGIKKECEIMSDHVKLVVLLQICLESPSSMKIVFFEFLMLLVGFSYERDQM